MKKKAFICDSCLRPFLVDNVSIKRLEKEGKRPELCQKCLCDRAEKKAMGYLNKLMADWYR